ncbi:acyl-CoA dehydrogenase family protein [Corynebacterium heidelbergense]|uniref:acyl-CoA oxidase n=1 Tax=Corynebacterium heidelbergense TaxID=2055947 RepID=A0A364V701_9CORY|nr:acyl-CoA dehydrogenase family protein [Corynebacterium heidelbergense]RAV32443.1 acyl-CoA oxidase [Corynebacterium heidelbergense]
MSHTTAEQGTTSSAESNEPTNATTTEASGTSGTAAASKNSRGPFRREAGPARLDKNVDHAVAAELQKVLDGDFADTRQRIRTYLADENRLPRYDLSLEESRAHTTSQLSECLETGLPHGAFTKEQGGTGETGATLTGIEMLGHADLSLMVKSGVQWGLFGGAVGNLGTERHRDIVEDIINLKALGCFAMTERGHGSDVQSLETTGTYDPETQEFIVNSPTAASEKWYIGNAARDGRWAAVFCQLFTPDQEESHGVHCILVRIREDDGSAVEGVHIGDHGYKGGLRGVDNGTLMFDNVRVPRENLLNRFAEVDAEGYYSSPIENPNARFFTMLGALVRGRVTVGAAAGAAARTCLDIGVRYANLRRQFRADDSLPEKKLIEYRQHRLRLIPRVARAYALQFATNRLISRVHELEELGLDRAKMSKQEQQDQREVEAHAAALKVANTQHATDVIQEMREATGGYGYMAENLLTTMKADSDIFTTFEGDNVVMMQLCAKELMTGFAKELGGLKPMEMVRFGLDNFATLLRRRTAADTIIQNFVDTFTDSEETSLFDPAYQVKLLTEREDRLMLSLARRLRPAKKMPVEEAAVVVDEAQDHLLAVGWAHVDRILMEAFLDAESKVDSERAAEVLEQLRDVYFLNLVVRDAAWYLEQNLLSGTRTKSARAALNDLVDSLGPWSEVLVDAFGVPRELTNVDLMSDYEEMVPKAESCPAAGQKAAQGGTENNREQGEGSATGGAAESDKPAVEPSADGEVADGSEKTNSLGDIKAGEQ